MGPEGNTDRNRLKRALIALLQAIQRPLTQADSTESKHSSSESLRNTITAHPLPFALALASITALAIAAPLCAQALAEEEDALPETETESITLTIKIEGYKNELPVLVAGEDFTLGQAIQGNPVYMTDENGNQPLASFVEGKQAEGLTLVWSDDSGNEFDWFNTAVTENTTVTGTFVEAPYEVLLSFDDNSTEDIAVQVTKGQTFKEAYGSVPQTPSKEGYTFVRWVNAADGSTFDFDAPVTSSTSVYALYRIASPDQISVVDATADIPQTLTGRCYIGATWSVGPAHFSVSRFTGELAGCSGTGTCSMPGSAAPSYVWADYTATLTNVDIEKGQVTYSVHIVPPNAGNPNGPYGRFGPLGYQTVSFTAVVQKNFGGYLKVQKICSNPSLSEGLETYSLKGAIFGVYNASGELVDELETDDTGATEQSILLPVGTYTIRETKAPVGYATAPDKTVEVKAASVTETTVSDAPQCSLVDLLIEKLDHETHEGLPLGSATLEGALFTVSYYDRHLTSEEAALAAQTEADGAAQSSSTLESTVASWGDPVRTWSFATDAQGEVRFDAEHLIEGDEFYRDLAGNIALPLGTLVIQENGAPQGYLANDGIVVRDLQATANAEHITQWQKAVFEDQVKRGDLAFTKVASDTMERMTNIPFLISSQTTGEAHTLVTDENGMASTASSWAKHSQNTNAGTSSEDGIWFGINESGTEAPVNDLLGALPYDTYRVEEQACAANDGYDLVSFTITISRDSVTLDIGTVDDDPESLEISGEVDKRQTAVSEDGTFTYSIDYRSTSSTWADEFNMVDEIACATAELAELIGIETPVCFEDYDGTMNVWYRTNLDDVKENNTANSDNADNETTSETDVTTANACATNPYNPKNPTTNACMISRVGTSGPRAFLP